MPKPFNRFIEELSRLPGIGEKTASRLAFFILKQDKGLARNIAHSLIEMREKIFFCSECFALTEKSFCHICSNPQKDEKKTCSKKSLLLPRQIWKAKQQLFILQS